MEGDSEVDDGPNINSVLKPFKARMPLKEIVLSSHDDENTATRKRRVSFANVNKIKEFSSGAESLVVCHTPAYEEPFSISSDSSYPGTNGSTLAKRESTANLKDSTPLKMDITSCSMVIQSNLKDSVKSPSGFEFILDMYNSVNTASYTKELNLTDKSSNSQIENGMETMDLTEAASFKTLVGNTCWNTYSNKSHQVSTEFTRCSASYMDLTNGVGFYNLSKNDHDDSLDNTKLSESELNLTKPVVSNITNKVLLPNENTRFSMSDMHLTNIELTNNLPENHDNSVLELTDAIREPNMVGVSTNYSTFDMEFTRELVKNDYTRYSTNMDFTDIINNDESGLSETAMDFTKPIHNVLNVMADKNYTVDVSNINVSSDQSQLSEICSSTSESEIKDGCSINYNDISNAVNNDVQKQNLNSSLVMQTCASRHDIKDTENCLTYPLIDIDNSCNVSLECMSQNTSCDEDKELEGRNSSFYMNIESESFIGCSSSKCNKSVKKENYSITIAQETSISKDRRDSEQNRTLNIGGGLLPLFSVEGNKDINKDKSIIATEIVSTDLIYKDHNHDLKKNILKKKPSQLNYTPKKSPSNKLVSPSENIITDYDTSKINTSVQTKCSKNEIAIIINDSLNNVNYETIDFPSPEISINNSGLLQQTQSIEVCELSGNKFNEDILQSEAEKILNKVPSNIEINSNISAVENISVNKSITGDLCKKNITLTRGGSAMLYSTLLISDDETGHRKGESNDSVCNIKDASISESIPFLQQMKSNQDKSNVKGADFYTCKDVPFDDCKDSTGANKGGKRSFEVALESENETEESPIKLMCIEKHEKVDGSEGLLNVTSQPFLTETVMNQNNTTQDIILTKINENTDCLKKLKIETIKQAYDNCPGNEHNNSLNILHSDAEHHKSQMFLPSDSNDIKENSLVIIEPRKDNENNLLSRTKIYAGKKIGTNINGILFDYECIIRLANGMYGCDLIPKWIHLQFGVDCNGFITTKIYKIICSERVKCIGEYLLSQIKTSAIPEHISELTQHIKEPRDNFLCELARSLSVICKYHNGNLDNNMLTIEMNSCKKKFWLYVVINIKYPQLLSATDINIHENLIGDIKLSQIRQIFSLIQRSNNQLLCFTEALTNLQYQ